MQDKKILELQIMCGKIRKDQTCITQKKISEYLHICMNTISNFEKGKHKNTDLLLFYINMFINYGSLDLYNLGWDLLYTLMNLAPDFKEKDFMED